MGSVAAETCEGERRAPGRPRSTEADRAILDATIELLADVGYGGLSVEAVAATAGVGKATIYRRFPSKVDLVIAALTSIATPTATLPEDLPTRDAMVAAVRQLMVCMKETPLGRVLPALVAEFPRHPELARAFREDFLTSRRAAGRALIERGVETGELRADVDREVLLDLVPALIYYRLLVTGGKLERSVAERLVDQLLDGAAP